MQIPLHAKTVTSLMRQWDEGAYGLLSVTSMKEDDEYVLDKPNKANYYRRIDIVEVVNRLTERMSGLASRARVIEVVEAYRVRSGLQLNGFNTKLKSDEQLRTRVEEHVLATLTHNNN